MMTSSIQQRDPIAAIATPVGEAGIAVIRVSGHRSIELVEQVFKGKKLSRKDSHTAHFGIIMDGNRKVDEVLATVFRSPRSYTGEDTVEISCHGGVLITQDVLETLLKQGIRSAGPGEFTQRSFLNGKMELSQAEAVADLIHAQSRRATEAAQQQLEGRLGEHIRNFRQQIIDSTALVELELDFVEEDVEFASKEELRGQLVALDEEIGRLLQTYEAGRLVMHGVQTVFVGRPNAGKSTLLNTLMGKDRAIVSQTAGTTRDVVDADWSYEGLLFNLTDTAGLRETADEIEAEGVRRSEKAISDADLIVYLRDLSFPLEQAEKQELEKIRSTYPGKSMLRVGTKKDLMDDSAAEGRDLDLQISATTGEGIEELKKKMKQAVLHNREIDTSGLLVTSSRHRDALEKTRQHVRRAMEAIDRGESGDILAIDLRSALQYLGEITGEITTEDLLDSIFSRFCIGK